MGWSGIDQSVHCVCAKKKSILFLHRNWNNKKLVDSTCWSFFFFFIKKNLYSSLCDLIRLFMHLIDVDSHTLLLPIYELVFINWICICNFRLDTWYWTYCNDCIEFDIVSESKINLLNCRLTFSSFSTIRSIGSFALSGFLSLSIGNQKTMRQYIKFYRN